MLSRYTLVCVLEGADAIFKPGITHVGCHVVAVGHKIQNCVLLNVKCDCPIGARIIRVLVGQPFTDVQYSAVHMFMNVNQFTAGYESKVGGGQRRKSPGKHVDHTVV